jgi:hypothetical protein
MKLSTKALLVLGGVAALSSPASAAQTRSLHQISDDLVVCKFVLIKKSEYRSILDQQGWRMAPQDSAEGSRQLNFTDRWGGSLELVGGTKGLTCRLPILLDPAVSRETLFHFISATFEAQPIQLANGDTSWVNPGTTFEVLVPFDAHSDTVRIDVSYTRNSLPSGRK